MDGGAWWAAVHVVAKSRTRLSDFTFTYVTHQFFLSETARDKHFLLLLLGKWNDVQ